MKREKYEIVSYGISSCHVESVVLMSKWDLV